MIAADLLARCDRGGQRRALSRFVTAAALALAILPARAQSGSSAGIPMIRDAEIEQLAARLHRADSQSRRARQQNVQVVIINDDSFNAFVMDAHRIFVNTGALMQATTPNQLIGVFCPRDRPYRRRPSVQDAPGTRQRPDRADHRHAARRRRHGGRRRAFQQCRHGQCRRRRDRRAAGDAMQHRSSPISAPRKNRPTAPACAS